MRRIAIFGTGALGSLFASLLSRNATVTMIGTWAEQIAAIEADGILVHHLDGSEERFHPHVTKFSSTIREVDLVLVLVKSHQTARIAPMIPQVVAMDGVVITLQNGLGNLEKIVAQVGEDRATAGITSQGATMLAPGIVRHAGNAATSIGQIAARADQVEAAVALLNQSGIQTNLLDQVDPLIWGKLAVNAGINPLTALFDVDNGALLTDPLLDAAMVAAAVETERVASAYGIMLPYDDVAAHVRAISRATAKNVSSMRQDMRRGVRTENDAISAAIVGRGMWVDVETPINELLSSAIRSAEKGEPFKNQELLSQLKAAIPH